MAGLRLEDFLRDRAGRKYALGSNDCALFIADWVALNRGVDPAKHCRGLYHTGKESEQFQGGGLLRAVGRALRGAGLKRTKRPKKGDVGAVEFGARLCFGIKTDTGWALLLEDGLALIKDGYVTLAAAWRI